ncbi:MAG TPA: hypothetical protein PK286_02025 [Devosia sp.]|nr:hypothetical protein [Devosia sp.]
MRQIDYPRTAGTSTDHDGNEKPRPAAGDWVPLSIWGQLLSHPANIAFAIVLLSVALLQIPQEWYGRFWGVGGVSFGLAEVALLCFVYLIFYSAWWLASEAAHPGLRQSARAIVFDRASYAWLAVVTAAGALGVAATVAVLISRLGLAGIINAFATNQANELKFALYDDYSIGLSSLRYCPIIAAPAAALLVLRLGVRTRFSLFLLAVAVSSLLLNAVISHRLSVAAAIVVYAVLHFRSGGRLAWRTIALGAGLVIALLTVLNASRNANFYSGLGINNPLMAALSEAISYVATPAQGALAAMSGILTGNFHNATGISIELTTNSSLLEGMQQYGHAGLFIELALTTVCAFVYVRAYFSTRLEMVAGAGVIGYAFAEFWRVFLFQYGIFIVLVFFTFAAGFAVRLAWNSMAAAEARREADAATARPPAR